MTTYRTLTTIGGLLLTASLVWAQVAPPAPPAPPAPAPAPVAAPAPMPVPTPMAAPAAAADLMDVPMPPEPPQAPLAPLPPTPAIAPMDAMKMAQDALSQIPPDLDVQMAKAKAQLDNLNLDIQIPDVSDFQYKLEKDIQDKVQNKIQSDVYAKVAEANAKAAASYAKVASNYNFNFNFDKGLAFQQARAFYPGGPRGSEEAMYQNGLRDIDNHQYEQALSEFNMVVSRAGARADGALYWKAYVLNKQGRAADAQAAIETLRKSYPSSKYLDDAKALELEVKQSKGPVSPESESDEDIKILALNGLMQSDPERALPQVENLLKGSHSPKLKRQALYVIAESNTPKAQQMLEQIARSGNPDLQVRAIQFMSERRNSNTPKVLMEIYTSTSDPAVKRAILEVFSNNRDKARLMSVLQTERDGNIRSVAINRLGDVDGQPELWQIYQSETTTEGKMAVLDAMRHNGNLDKLTEVAKTDKDPKVRQRAIEVIATQDGSNSMATLVSLYSTEQDEKVKSTIIDHLSSRRNGDCKPLVDVAKSEKDMQMKMRLIRRLSDMTRSCQAANDYLMEILSK